MPENGSKSLKNGQKTIKNGKKHSKTASGPIREEIEQKIAKIAKSRPTEHTDKHGILEVKNSNEWKKATNEVAAKASH